jgi:hypothetical protein
VIGAAASHATANRRVAMRREIMDVVVREGSGWRSRSRTTSPRPARA